MIEVWRAIPGFKGLYDASTMGRVRSRPRNTTSGKILKPININSGYLRVCLCVKNVKYNLSVHRLVSITFIPNPSKKPFVNHKNGRKHDNHIGNLEWATRSENDLHASRVLGAKWTQKPGEKHSMAKLTAKDVRWIRKHRCHMKGSDLARMFKISQQMISDICLRRRWVHIS